ncbi:MAG: dTDP-4-dehydrorhamnose reductase [Planctomycetaceae bacterium]
MRIALIGATGQLGTDLAKILPGDGIEVVSLAHRQIELSSDQSVSDRLNETAPDLVINCAAFNLVDQAESEPVRAYEVNSLGPRRIAHWCTSHSATLVHFSSDYVFGLDPDHGRPRSEIDAPGPQSAYAASKLQGEYYVRSLCPESYILRTCGLYGLAAFRGSGGGNFVETMIRLGRTRDRLTVVHDQHCTPTSTVDLAAATVALIGTGAYGLYHVTNSGATTWHDFAAEIFRREAIEVELTPITSAEFGAAAARPLCSVLDTSRIESAIGRPMPAWQDALQRYLDTRRSLTLDRETA